MDNEIYVQKFENFTDTSHDAKVEPKQKASHRQKRDETGLEQSDLRAQGKSERWTKEEHERFIKAVETYGRKK